MTCKDSNELAAVQSKFDNSAILLHSSKALMTIFKLDIFSRTFLRSSGTLPAAEILDRP